MRARLGQNFLHDSNWQEKIVSYFRPTGNFGEIGPGHGELTSHLQNKFSDFYVFEKDRYLVNVHRENKNYTLIEGDFLDWNFKDRNGAEVRDFSFIGNLPYESGSAIVLRMVEKAEAIEGFLFLLQKEVVERICAKPQSRDFASFTVVVQGQFEVEALDIIPPSAFTPAPKVFSQLVRAKRRATPHSREIKYRKFVHSAFMSKRKTLRNNLKSLFPLEKIDAVLSKLELTSLSRPEEIPVELWPTLYEELKS